MKNNIKIIIALFFTSVGIMAQNQLDPMYTQYMYNMSIINPAYTTSDVGTINGGLIHRRQYAAVDGHVTTSLFGHAALSDKVEVGISYYNDNFDDVFTTNDVNADFAYKLNFDNGYTLSLGLKAGANLQSLDNSDIQTANPGDPAFDNTTYTNFNLGAGAYFNSDKFYVGVSSPNFIQSETSNIDNLDNPNERQIHAYLTGGYVFQLSDNVKFKPASIVRMTEGTPLTFDVTANFLLYEKLELGAAYRLDESVSGLINFRIVDNLRLGYAYDFTISEFENSNTGGSHEFLLLFDLNIMSKKYDKSPRFF